MTTCTFLDCEDGQLIIEVCKQGPQGPAGSGAAVTPPGPIPPSTMQVSDTLPIADYYAAKWIIHLITVEGTPRYRAVEVLGMYNGTTSFYNITGAVGEAIAVSIVVDLNGANLELQVTNNEAVDVEVRILRLAIET